MWQKPAQPSASYIPASNRGSGFCSLYRYPLFAFLLSSCILSSSSSSSSSRSLRLTSFFPSRPVARSSLLLPLLSLITVGVARQQPVHRGQANFLPAVILFRSSLLSLSLGLSRPLRRESLPFAPRSLYPLPLSISRRFCPFSSFPSTPSGSSRPVRHSFLYNGALLLFPRLYRSNPIL